MTSDTILLSVVIPVYNVEPYIGKCLDALLAQIDSQVEIICVDDGSQDRSGTICDEYASQYENVHVYHKVNGGVASARNCAMEHIHGLYTVGCDPDDFVEVNWWKTIRQAIQSEQVDLYHFDYFFIENDQKKEIHADLPSNISVEQYIFESTCDRKITGSLCNKVIRSSIMLRYRFNEDAIILEDYQMLTNIMADVQTIRYERICLYDYIRRSNSLVNQANKEKLTVAMKSAYERMEIFRKKGFRVSRSGFWKYLIIYCIKLVSDHPDTDYLANLQQTKRELKNILRCPELRAKDKAAALLVSVAPLSFVSFLWKVTVNRRFAKERS